MFGLVDEIEMYLGHLSESESIFGIFDKIRGWSKLQIRRKLYALEFDVDSRLGVFRTSLGLGFPLFIPFSARPLARPKFLSRQRHGWNQLTFA